MVYLRYEVKLCALILRGNFMSSEPAGSHFSGMRVIRDLGITVTELCCIHSNQGFIGNCRLGWLIPWIHIYVAFDIGSIF